MKSQCIILVAGIILMSQIGLHAQVAITNDGSAPHSSAMLEVKSTNRGMLVPRMTTNQRTTISSPAPGLLVYDTDTQSFWVRNSSAWQEIRDGNITSLADNDNDTKVMAEESSDEDIIRFDLGGTQRMVLLPNRLELHQSNFNLSIGPNAGRLTAGLQNTFLGYSSGYSNISGINNTAVGFKSLYFNESGNFNSAFGNAAIFSNQVGSYNTACGYGSLYANDTGSCNTAVGSESLFYNTEGEYNTAIGFKAIYENTTGNYNTSIGSFSLLENTTGRDNTALGYATSSENQTGEYNVAVGSWASTHNISGSNNIAVGSYTLHQDTIGHNNIAIGPRALYYNKNRSHLVAIGDSALFNNSNGAYHSSQGIYNTAIGSKALALNTTGSKNTATGYEALGENNTGSDNCAGGYMALHLNTTGSSNTATGSTALAWNQGGSHNTAYGCNALVNNTSGEHNVAIGSSANYGNSTGNNNTAVGYRSLYYDEGANNTALGYMAGQGNIYGAYFSNNLLLGYSAGFALYDGDNNILIGYQAGDALVYGSNNIIIGYDIDASNQHSDYEMILGHPDLLFGDIANKKIGIGTTQPECQLHISHIQDAMLILEADANNTGETDNPRLELRQDGELVRGALGYTGDINSIYANSIANSMYLVNDYASALHLGTDSTLAMTILSDGSVGIGTTGPTQLLDVNGNARFRSVGSGTYSMPLNLTSTGILTTSTSDARLKTNVEEIDDGLSLVMNLRGVRFNWMEDPDGKKMIGFIAQEAEESVPELVYTNPADGYKGVNYAEMTAVLVEAVKEQQKQIEVLQKKVDELENLVGSTLP